MCGGVEAREADKVWQIYFPNPKAAIPVLLEDSGQLDWIISQVLALRTAGRS